MSDALAQTPLRNRLLRYGCYCVTKVTVEDSG